MAPAFAQGLSSSAPVGPPASVWAHGVSRASADVNVPGGVFAVFRRWPEVELRGPDVGVAGELLDFLDRRPVLQGVRDRRLRLWMESSPRGRPVDHRYVAVGQLLSRALYTSQCVLVVMLRPLHGQQIRGDRQTASAHDSGLLVCLAARMLLGAQGFPLFLGSQWILWKLRVPCSWERESDSWQP